MASRSLLLAFVIIVAARSPNAEADVTVFLDGGGRIVTGGTRLPAYGGGERAWRQVVACVREQYAPFAVDIVTEPPASGAYITAVIGGRASQLGLDDKTTAGIGPWSGSVQPDATVYVFSQNGRGDGDAESVCATAVHEIGHALGLEHEYHCGDVMSYFHRLCGPEKFVDIAAPCGETAPRACTGAPTQNSFRKLGKLVGFRTAQEQIAAPQQSADDAATITICASHHCQSRNLSRNSVFLNFPADVRGIASTNTNASGSQNFANRGAR